LSFSRAAVSAAAPFAARKRGEVDEFLQVDGLKLEAVAERPGYLARIVEVKSSNSD
jgi:hypothetical protein